MVKELKQRYQNLILPVKASIWFVVCGVLKDVIDVLVTPVFTRILTTEQYGVYNVYNSWFQIVKIIFTLYLFSEVFNVGLVKFEEERDKFVSSTLGFVTALVGIYLVVYLVFRRQINDIIELPGYLVLLMFAHVLTYVPYYCWIRRERFDYHYKNVVKVSFLYVILQPLLGIVAILCMDISVNPGYTRILAAVGVQIAIGAVLYAGMISRGRIFYSRKYWTYSLKTGIELVPFNLSKVVLNQSDRIMINYFTGSGDTGIYSVAHSAAFVLQVVTEALNGAFVPWLYRRLQSGQLSGVKKVVNGLIVIVVVSAFGIDMIAPEIMKILGSEEYYKGLYCIPALVCSVYMIFVYMLFTNVELYYGRNTYVTIASTVGMAVNIVLNAIFIPVYGFIAAGYTTLAGYMVMCVGHFVLLRKCLNAEKMKMGDLFDVRVVVFISGLLLTFTFCCGLLYRWTPVRWIFIIGLVLLAFINKDKLMRFLRELREGDQNNG